MPVIAKGYSDKMLQTIDGRQINHTVMHMNPTVNWNSQS